MKILALAKFVCMSYLSGMQAEPEAAHEQGIRTESDAVMVRPETGIDRGLDESLRFGFGRNWKAFIEEQFSETRVRASQEHLLATLRLPSLDGLSFLDIGCGSGLHSLAALRAGAQQVTGFDFDADSVATSLRVRDLAANSDPRWTAEQGSVLDRARVEALPKFDVVYSWGVLHHTGDMWTAMDNAVVPLKSDGVLYIALYSSDQYVDPSAAEWVRIKRAYNQAGPLKRRWMEWRHAWRVCAPQLRRLEMPWTTIRNYGSRGMEFWTDVRDWLGGWPIEFASYTEVESWAQRRNLRIVNAVLGEGCTEYVLANIASNAQWCREEERRLASLKPMPSPFVRGHGLEWIAQVPDLAAESDTSARPRGSRLMLYDRDRPVGLCHCTHDHIARFGRGRFSHWVDAIRFSTPDGSDPNSDPARWRYCREY